MTIGKGMTKEVEVVAPPEINFFIEKKELLRMTPKGIELNRENFPDFKPDDFAREFLFILEENINVSFSVKDPKSGFVLKPPGEKDE
jgi:hypothetical protein